MQLAAPAPYDLDRVNLAEYKGVKPPLNEWRHVAEVCGKLSDQLLNACVQALRADTSPESQQAQTKIDAWREARAAGGTSSPHNLPGLET